MAAKKKLFIKALDKKFATEKKLLGAAGFKEDNLQGQKTTNLRLGPEQNARKREFMEYSAKLAGKRGISFYNPYVHAGGIPLGQRQLVPYKLSGTEYVVEGDDLHFVNNPAIQQMWDDIRRTIVVGLDMAHEVLQKRLGKEVTPETINNYLEILNHAMPGAAVVQEHMVETHPGLVDDCNVRVFTGDDALADEIDSQYLIDINKSFPAEQAESIKAAMGKTTWQAIHVPTIVVRSCDGGTTSRWSAMQLCMTFIDAYNMCAGEAAVADLAYAAKHAAVLQMSEMLPARRARGPNNPGGLSFGFLADMIQTSRTAAADPVKVALNVVAAGAALYDQIWLGSYMSGGVGFTQYATAAYTNDVLDDFCYYGVDFAADKFKGFAKAPKTIDTAKELATEVNAYGMEQYEEYPTLLEDHFGGSQRASVLAAASAITTAIASGHSQVGLAGWYLSMLLHKEGWGRLGFFGYDLQDQCGPTNVFSYQSDEGNPLELRGANYPNYAMNVGHQGEYAGISSAAHAGRMDAFACNPLIKVCFANPALVFNWADVRDCFGKGGAREFRAAGERSLVMPAV
jgi:methyl-coenzyme M reductase alpha subunit